VVHIPNRGYSANGEKLTGQWGARPPAYIGHCTPVIMGTDVYQARKFEHSQRHAIGFDERWRYGLIDSWTMRMAIADGLLMTNCPSKNAQKSDSMLRNQPLGY